MRKLITRPVKWFFGRLGYDVVPADPARAPEGGFPPDYELAEIEDYQRVAPFTLTGPERTVALIRAVRYLVENDVPGDIVECGVWKGGSMMAVALTLLRLGSRHRSLWLYDTFAGMSEPTAHDVSVVGISAQKDFESDFLRVPLEAVRRALLSTGYDGGKMTFVKGKVEDTIPQQIPEKIALLRLDTDWYESTRHELHHLFPRLVPGGVLIIDDYGHWKGAREATDEYFRAHGVRMLLHRIDFSARIGVKLGEGRG